MHRVGPRLQQAWGDGEEERAVPVARDGLVHSPAVADLLAVHQDGGVQGETRQVDGPELARRRGQRHLRAVPTLHPDGAAPDAPDVGQRHALPPRVVVRRRHRPAMQREPRLVDDDPLVGGAGRGDCRRRADERERRGGRERAARGAVLARPAGGVLPSSVGAHDLGDSLPERPAGCVRPDRRPAGRPSLPAGRRPAARCPGRRAARGGLRPRLGHRVRARDHPGSAPHRAGPRLARAGGRERRLGRHDPLRPDRRLARLPPRPRGGGARPHAPTDPAGGARLDGRRPRRSWIADGGY